ncbi:MAG: N-acetylneuraminate synthase family protein [Gammaproteobacteria bacterium]
MHQPDRVIDIEGRLIGETHPTYFVADIAANHDGDLGRACDLIRLAADAGADAAKFQHFTAATIVSDAGFRALGSQQSHQRSWKKSVFEVYQDATLNADWTGSLRDACKAAGITFFTSPYSFELVDRVDPFVPAYKIGSGDITWTGIVEHIASRGKPTLLAAGASTMDDVERAVNAVLRVNPRVVLMQCNTNYTASLENFRYIQLNVLRSFRAMYPDMVLGLSDHTPGHATVLGSVALGARVIEKHFTDDCARVGPDHKFSMDPRMWRDMVDRTRELEAALGVGIKKVEDNEAQTVILQRRSIRTTRDMAAGETLTAEALSVLRPCPADGIPPYRVPEVAGRRLRRSLKAGDHVRWSDLD